jgi:carboxyl-terminal processing protease
MQMIPMLLPPFFRAPMRRGFAALLAVGLAPASLLGLQEPETRPAVPPFSSDLALQTFDSVWSRVANTHYDPDMGGVDWEAVRAELEPRAAASTSNEELRGVLSDMVSRLGLSHFVIFGPEAGAALEAASDEAGGAPSGGAGNANPGVDVRVIEDRVRVVRVRPGSPADRAGVRPGWEVMRIGSHDPNDLPPGVGESLAAMGTPEDRIRGLYLPMIALGALQGREGQPVEIAFTDGEGREQVLTLDRVPPAGELARFGYLPPFPVEVTDRAVALSGGGSAGWIHFTGWFPVATPRIAEAVDRHRESRGMILDLRGNPGGLGGMAMGMAGHFIDERVSLGEMRNRQGTLHFNVSPQRVSPAGIRVDPFEGPLAILVDPLSASTSEIFAAGMQSLGRARVFGEVTAGQALPALIISLPNGDRLMHVIADYTAPGGVRLEGRGVIPDEVVHPSREALLAGRDRALEQALAWIAQTAAPVPSSAPGG